jgi:cyclopropane-fatty-acyl-phospholipid synthase
MPGLIPILEHEGIYPYGSPELIKQEKSVTRYLEKEYRSLLENPVSLEQLGISTREGAMWEETDELISEHYDERLEFFDTFLDNRFRAYSMAEYGSEPSDIIHSSRTLEEAQEQKFITICDRMGIRGNEKILNIGCGFGSFESFVFERFPDLDITSITPSNVQIHYLNKQIDTPGSPLHGKKLTLIQENFANLDLDLLGRESFDIVCSIGLLEQVRNMHSLFTKIEQLLKPGGRTFHHYIVSKMVIPQFLDAKQTLIGNYFPGGRIWPLEEMTRHTSLLDLQDYWFINGMNYWRTLDEWHRRFWQNLSSLSESLSIERIRHWNDYFYLCKACFAPLSGEAFGNGQYLFRKPG